MSFLSRDRETVLGAGGWTVCVECGEASHEHDTELHHHSWCSKAVGDNESEAPALSLRAPDPNMYVLTPNGIEREMDVARRHRR